MSLKNTNGAQVYNLKMHTSVTERIPIKHKFQSHCYSFRCSFLLYLCFYLSLFVGNLMIFYRITRLY